MKVKFNSLQVINNYGKGYQDGEEKGFNDGVAAGNEQGYNSALERLETADITANGTYTPNDIGFKKVVVNVPDLNGDYTTGYNDGYSKGNTDGYTQGNTDGFNSGYTQGESVGQENGYNNALSKLDELTITQNGEYTPTDDKIGFRKVIVETVDENGSYADGFNDGIAQGSQKLKSRISGETEYSLTAEDLDGITKINQYAFAGDTKIQSIEIPENITNIGTYAFMYSTIKEIKYNAINCSMSTNAFANAGGSGTKLIIGEKVSSIGTSAFYSFQYLTIVEFETNAILSTINDSMFSYCSNLTSVTIPNSVTTINQKAFNGCAKLNKLTIPASVRNIARDALKIGTSDNKATITFLGTNPPIVQPNTFSTSNLNQIIVPKGCGDIYKSSTNWSSFADYIIESET